MKKLIVCLLSVLVLLSLFAGCGTDEPGEVTPGETGKEDADFESIEDPLERLKAMIEAAGWPDGSIEFVVCNGVGGGSDQMARAVANCVNALDVGFNINVNNRTGSSGMIGAAYIVAIDTACLVVRSDSGFETMDDLVNYSLEHPGEIVFGGTNSNLSMDAIMYDRMVEQTGMQTEFVPFEGGGDVSTALLGGHITAAWQNPSEVAAYIESGDFRCIAMGSETRHEDYPDIPTAIEQGYPDVYFSLYRGVLAPENMPDEYIDILALAIEIGSQSETFQHDYIDANTVTYYFGGPEEMAEEMDYYEALFEEIIAESEAA